MQKIIINDCYGGYRWSDDAILDYLKRKGIKDIRLIKYVKGEEVDTSEEEFRTLKSSKDILVKGKDIPERTWCEKDKWYSFNCKEIDREDPIAIQLLEEKGTEYCSGEYAKLIIEEYDSDNWIAYINQYDGDETLKLKPRLTKERVRSCKNIEEVVELLNFFDLFVSE